MLRVSVFMYVCVCVCVCVFSCILRCYKYHKAQVNDFKYGLYKNTDDYFEL